MHRASDDGVMDEEESRTVVECSSNTSETGIYVKVSEKLLL